MLYHPALAIGTTSKFASSWKGPYVIENCLNDIRFRIKEGNSSKQQIVHYGRLNPYFEPLPTSNVPTRKKPRKFQSFQDRADTYKHIGGTLNHEDCFTFLPASFSIFTPTPAVGRATASTTTSRITPITSSASVRHDKTRSPPVFSRSPASEHPRPQARSDVATHSPTTLQIDLHTLIPENDFLHESQSPRDYVM